MLVAPWEVTELIVTAAARQNPAPILEYVADEERKAQYEAIHGHWSRGGRRSNDHYFEPEIALGSTATTCDPAVKSSAPGAAPKRLIGSMN